LSFFPFNLQAKREKLWGAAPGRASPGVPPGWHSGPAGQGNAGKMVSEKKILTIFTFFT